MEVKTLQKISGSWIEKGQGPYMKMAVKAEYDFSKISSRTKRAVIKALRTGVLNSVRGQAASVFHVVCEAFGLKYVCASRTGHTMYTNFFDQKFYEACEALNGLTMPKNHRRNSVTYMHKYNEHIASYYWHGKDEATANLFEEVMGFPDKEIREKAIDFLAEGGILAQTWIDQNPI